MCGRQVLPDRSVVTHHHNYPFQFKFEIILKQHEVFKTRSDIFEITALLRQKETLFQI